MPPTPLVAPYRLTLQYTVAGKRHIARYYLRCVSSADAWGFNTIPRSGYTAVGASTIGARVWGAIAVFYDAANTTFDSELLEANVAGAWIYVASQAAASGPGGSGAYAPAGMVTFSAKDTAGKNMPVFFYEMFFPGFIKVSSYAALSASNKVIADRFFNAGGGAVNADPVAWRVSRGSFFSQRWIAMVTDSNQKLRRIRGIA